jgi:hypothetical protein
VFCIYVHFCCHLCLPTADARQHEAARCGILCIYVYEYIYIEGRPKLGRSVIETVFASCANDLAYVGFLPVSEHSFLKNRPQDLQNRLPDGLFSKPSFGTFWKAVEWKILITFGILCSHLLYIMAI